METVKFTVPGLPKGKARARTVRGRGDQTFSYTPEGTVLYENLIKTSYLQQPNNKIFNDNQPLKVVVLAFYDIPKSYGKKKQQQMLAGEIRPTKKPDIDNIAKDEKEKIALVKKAFSSGWKSFYPLKKKGNSETTDKKINHNFTQRDYDFDALEKQFIKKVNENGNNR